MSNYFIFTKCFRPSIYHLFAVTYMYLSSEAMITAVFCRQLRIFEKEISFRQTKFWLLTRVFAPQARNSAIFRFDSSLACEISPTLEQQNAPKFRRFFV